MKTQEYRLINAKRNVKDSDTKSFEYETKKLISKIKPEDYECIATNNYIIVERPFNPDAIIVFKITRKIDYGIGKFPEHLQKDMQQLQGELKLTKRQIKTIYKQLKELKLEQLEIDKQLEILYKTAQTVHGNKKVQQQIDEFNARYSSFNECLTSQLNILDGERKEEVRKKLDDLIKISNSIIESYL